ncbi:ABC transporter permease [Halocatena salina]|uniref:ABC transporter permease n=1 Tax=Halocatena salina TaxID=2934340 RepID=A0A8U0A6D3_9EURY|nr:ABC transporter permease [Halocatena salina]UPM44730.1 ABC transporter permease [Halocatena salina]
MTNIAWVRDPDEYYYLLKAVVYRDLLIWLRYPVDAALGLFMNVFFFGLMFYGGSLIAGQAINDSIEGLIVGYFLWTLSVGAYAGIAKDIQSEANWGTLERHYITPFGFGPVIFAKAVAILFRTFLTSFLVLIAMLLLTGTNLNLHLLTIITVAILTIASALGFGFAMGGLSVLYKRISNITNILQFAFIGLISAPVFDLWWTKFLPLAQGSSLLQRAMKNGVRVWEFPPLELAILLGSAVFYLGIGYVVLIFATRRSRHLGVLGDY